MTDNKYAAVLKEGLFVWGTGAVMEALGVSGYLRELIAQLGGQALPDSVLAPIVFATGTMVAFFTYEAFVKDWISKMSTKA